MIKAVIIINNHGKPRLVKLYDSLSNEQQSKLVKECFIAVSKRTDNLCNFVELEKTFFFENPVKIIYRHYATLYFIFIVDNLESHLAILDLIQVFVEALDKNFENIYEIILAGSVLETNITDVLQAVNEIEKYGKYQNSVVR